MLNGVTWHWYLGGFCSLSCILDDFHFINSSHLRKSLDFHNFAWFMSQFRESVDYSKLLRWLWTIPSGGDFPQKSKYNLITCLLHSATLWSSRAVLTHHFEHKDFAWMMTKTTNIELSILSLFTSVENKNFQRNKHHKNNIPNPKVNQLQWFICSNIDDSQLFIFTMTAAPNKSIKVQQITRFWEAYNKLKFKEPKMIAVIDRMSWEMFFKTWAFPDLI